MHLMGSFPQVSASYIKPPKNAGIFFFQTVFHLNTTSVDCKEVAARRACIWPGVSLPSNWKPVLGQRST